MSLINEGVVGASSARCGPSYPSTVAVPGTAAALARDRARVLAADRSGVSSEDASVAVGVSPPVGSRWFGHGGGMAPLTMSRSSGRYLSLAEREETAILRAQDHGVREIARRLGRHPSTISR